MVTKTIEIRMGQTPEVRPVAMLVQLASKYDSSIYLEKGSRSVNAKSIMGMMTMGFATGETMTVSVAGPDEEAALEAIVAYLTEDNQ